jgi:uroporphyrinogen-III synthase
MPAQADAGTAPGMPPRVIVTRPQPQADDWVARLQALGLPAGALPLLGIDGPTDTQAVDAAWQQIAAERDADGRPLVMVMFVSPSAVQRFIERRPPGLSWPAAVVAAAPGQGTRQALAEAGVPEAALCSPPADRGQFDSEALWPVLQPRCAWPSAAALVVRGVGGRDWLAAQLRHEGAAVHMVEAYRRIAPLPDAAGHRLLADALARPQAHAWLLSSSEAAGHLLLLAPEADWASACAVATHPRIAETARQIGFGTVLLAEPSPQAVAAVLRSR